MHILIFLCFVIVLLKLLVNVIKVTRPSNLVQSMALSKTTAAAAAVGDNQREVVESDPKDNADEDDNASFCDTEAVTKEEEWITKRNTEVKTTRQVETRVKRQVVLEDGKVIEDSGPIVSINTTEDTDKQETETTEKHDLGLPDDIDIVDNATTPAIKSSANNHKGNKLNKTAELLESADLTAQQLEVFGTSDAKCVKKMVPRPADGLISLINDNHVVSHSEVKGYLETEAVQHLGDFPDEVFVNAINSGVKNVQEVLLTATTESQQQKQQSLAPVAVGVIANKSKSFKTIDSENTQKRRLAQEDGTLVTEKKTTIEHEVIVDDELPEKDDTPAENCERITTKEAAQRHFKQRDEQHVDLIADGKVVCTEMRYVAENMQIDKDCSLEGPNDWDSLSDRMRKLRKSQQKAALQQQQKTSLLADRKDALTKRPLDFDREEETRKGETMKWLESHFGSESTASNDSREDDITPIGAVDPTKKTFFNVTIKSNFSQNQPQPVASRETTAGMDTANNCERGKYAAMEYKGASATHMTGVKDRSRYYHGVSNWSERKEALSSPLVNHFSSKAFRDDLQETIKRNDLRKHNRVNGSLSRGSTANIANENYVSRENILQQKRQSLSSQFLAKSACDSRDAANDPDVERNVQQSDFRSNYISGGEVNKKDDNSSMRNILSDNEKEGNSMRQPVGFGSGHNVMNRRNHEFFDCRSKSCDRELDVQNESQYSRYDNKIRPTEILDLSKEKTVSKQIAGGGTLGRPTVPHRRRTLEKKLHDNNSAKSSSNFPHNDLHTYHNGHELVEPPPDYSPPPNGISPSPQLDYFKRIEKVNATIGDSQVGSSGSGDDVGGSSFATNVASTSQMKKQNQRTKIAPMTPAASFTYVQATNNTAGSHKQMVPSLRSSVPTQTEPLRALTSPTSQKSNKMGQLIGNSFRKLVSKIRSASGERKFRMKSRSKSREHSPSTQPQYGDKDHEKQASSITYQQYNVIDGHIRGGANQRGGNDISGDSSNQELNNLNRVEKSLYSNTLKKDRSTPETGKLAESLETYELNRETDPVTNPRQRYYLGEDPYSSSLYGKENIYDLNKIGSKASRICVENGGNGDFDPNQTQKRHIGEVENEFYNPKATSIYTLGRFQKSKHHVSGSTPNLHQEFRTIQTLPRKLHESNQQQQPQLQLSRSIKPYNLGASSHHTLRYLDKPSSILPPCVPSAIGFQQQQSQYVGPTKPARTYAKVLNRSKSFNVHGMNGSNNPNLIYIEKLTKNNYHTSEACNNNNKDGYNHMSSLSSGTNRNGSNLYSTQAFKSNPHLFPLHKENFLQSGLKSPSIVNLISRSQKDLSKIGVGADNDANHNDRNITDRAELSKRTSGDLTNQRDYSRDDKKQLFLRGSQQNVPNLYQPMHGIDANASTICNKAHAKNQLQTRYSFESCSPVEVNKDTASIIRRGSSSNNEFDKNNKRKVVCKDGKLRRGTVLTIESRK